LDWVIAFDAGRSWKFLVHRMLEFYFGFSNAASSYAIFLNYTVIITAINPQGLKDALQLNQQENTASLSEFATFKLITVKSA